LEGPGYLFSVWHLAQNLSGIGGPSARHSLAQLSSFDRTAIDYSVLLEMSFGTPSSGALCGGTVCTPLTPALTIHYKKISLSFAENGRHETYLVIKTN
jgi:hypothetical protein